MQHCGMARQESPAPTLPLLFSRAQLPYDTSPRTLERDAKASAITRVHRGVYAGRRHWEAASDRQHARARTAAIVRTRRDRVIASHETAALLWGLPRLGRWPDVVDLVDARGTSPRSRNGVRWHRTAFVAEEVVEIDGFLVTGLLQTLADVARSRSFTNAVVALDAATGVLVRRDQGEVISGVPAAEILVRLRAFGGRRGVREAERAIEFADPRSESVGESLSRSQIHLLGFPPPELQVGFDRSDGGIDRVDFDWPEFRLFGEFDGDLKYLDPLYRRGRTIEQVILDEKKRADGICRRHDRRSARWDWAIARSAPRLRRVLLEAGIPLVRAARRR